MLAFVPGSRPFDLFDQDRHGPHEALCPARLHHRRRRPLAALPALCARHRRFCRPAAQCLARDDPGKPAARADPKALPTASSATLAKLAENDPAAYAKIWENFGVVLKEGLYEDFERRDQLLKLARFRSTGLGRWPAQPRRLLSRDEGGAERRSSSWPATIAPGWKPRRSSKVSGRAASRCCC